MVLLKEMFQALLFLAGLMGCSVFVGYMANCIPLRIFDISMVLRYVIDTWWLDVGCNLWTTFRLKIGRNRTVPSSLSYNNNEFL